MNVLENTALDVPVFEVKVWEPDGDPVEYFVTDGGENFRVDKDTGWVYPAKHHDFEAYTPEEREIEVQFLVRDINIDSVLQVEQSIIFYIVDENGWFLGSCWPSRCLTITLCGPFLVCFLRSPVYPWQIHLIAPPLVSSTSLKAPHTPMLPQCLRRRMMRAMILCIPLWVAKQRHCFPFILPREN